MTPIRPFRGEFRDVCNDSERQIRDLFYSASVETEIERALDPELFAHFREPGRNGDPECDE